MDISIKNISKYIDNLSSDDKLLIFISKENKYYSISPNILLNMFMDSNLKKFEFPEEMTNCIEQSFNNPNVVYSGVGSEFLYDVCENKGRIETDIRLTVRRSIIFNYDSYIYFNEYQSNKPDYWNYTAQPTLNDKIYICRLMIYKDNTWKISCYPVTDRGNQTVSNTL